MRISKANALFLVGLLDEYVEAMCEYKIASTVTDEAGYTSTAQKQRLEMEKKRDELARRVMEMFRGDGGIEESVLYGLD